MWREQLEVLPELNRQLKQAIDDDGYVTDEASPALKAIRQNIRRSEQTIREELDSIIRGKTHVTLVMLLLLCEMNAT